MGANIKTLSCLSLHHALYLAPDMLRHCCKRFFVNGQMRGDVKVYSVHGDGDIDVTRILTAKRELYDSINRGIETQCSGCPFLTLDMWGPLEELKINLLSIESHTVCNMKCTYCSETYYGGLKAKYNLRKLLEHFLMADAFSEDIDIVWGGGEPTLMGDFEGNLQLFAHKLKPKSIKIFTNAIKYSSVIEKYLRNGQLTITISTDAGTKETFKKVRGVEAFEKVFSNIKKYHNAAGSGVIIKYILTEDNCSLEEIDNFLEQLNKYELNKSHFQLSADFKKPDLDKEQAKSLIYLYKELVRQGANSCHFDDHLRPRWSRKISEIYNSDSKQENEFQLIIDYIAEFQGKAFIVWGAGQLGYMMIKYSQLLEISKAVFIVDKDETKHGKRLCNIEIKPPDFIKQVDYPIVIASSRFYNEISREISDMGISKDRIMDNLLF